MTVVAVIEDPAELNRIIEWAKRKEGESSLPEIEVGAFERDAKVPD